MSSFPEIDPRIKAWSPAKLRLVSTPDMLRAAVAENLIILQGKEEPIAVLINYAWYLHMQAHKPSPEEPVQ